MFSLDPNFQGIESVEGSVIGFGNGNGNGVEVVEGGRRGKRGRPVLEQLDKAAQQRQRRMIKNRESAARSRERKQVYSMYSWCLCFCL
jgi:ABA responsive element binding factor